MVRPWLTNKYVVKYKFVQKKMFDRNGPFLLKFLYVIV